jgi:hypothetical protein
MMTPCETILKKFLPALKAGIAQELYEEHGMKQVDIAKRLGVTQAAVSKYISQDFEPSKEAAAEAGKIDSAAKKIANGIAKQKISEGQLAMLVCTACLELNKGYECVFHEAMVKAK